MTGIAGRLARSTSYALAGGVCLLLMGVVALDVALAIVAPLGELFLLAEPQTEPSPTPPAPAPAPAPDCTPMPDGLVICD